MGVGEQQRSVESLGRAAHSRPHPPVWQPTEEATAAASAVRFYNLSLFRLVFKEQLFLLKPRVTRGAVTAWHTGEPPPETGRVRGGDPAHLRTRTRRPSALLLTAPDHFQQQGPAHGAFRLDDAQVAG